LLADAGFTGIKVSKDEMGFFFKSPEERIPDIVVSAEGNPLKTLTRGLQELIIAEHKEELAKLMTSDGIFLQAPALFSFGSR